MKEKKDSPQTQAEATGKKLFGKYTKRKRKRIWPQEYKWRTPNEVLTWESGLK